MYEALSIAATGLINQQRRLDTIADNVSNANTNGFKSSRLEFKDALYTAGIVPAAPRTPEGNQQKGHGVAVSTIQHNFTTGSLITTNQELDFVIEGEGFFSVENANGDTIYTRGGNFYAGAGENGAYLVNGAGYYVLDPDGDRIRIPDGTQSVSVSQDGALTFVTAAGESQAALGVFTFRNVGGLEALGGGNYGETAASGERLRATDVEISQGFIEGSNVDLGTEMTRLVRAQRAFSLAGRALTTADDMEGIANNLRR